MRISNCQKQVHVRLFSLLEHGLICVLCLTISASASLRSVAHYERPRAKGPDHELVVVFVHGLFGDSETTWTNANGVYWPELLSRDEVVNDSDVYVASYPSPYFGNSMNIEEVVSGLNNQLVNDEIFSKHREVIFVCHSLGGLIVQRLLTEHREYAPSVKFLYLFASPETGAEVAKLGTYFSRDPLLKTLLSGDENVYLQTLEDDWRTLKPHVQTLCAYEKRPLPVVGIIVDRLSGTRNCDDFPIAIDENHNDIVKPNSARQLGRKGIRPIR
jgi:pimeloyl-ACP methyl ester carboxylesterase